MGREEHDRAVRFRTARRDPDLTVVEGFHALKHALRFGAELVEAVAVDPSSLDAMAAELAPDLAGQLSGRVEQVDKEALADLVPLVPHTGVAAIARRPRVDLEAALADPAAAPAILLEQPRNMGNIGACIRVSAAGGAAAVITTGENDPWHPDAVRGAAGLQFALPVAKVEALPRSDRPLLAIDPEGEELAPAAVPPRAILAFGTERHGLSSEVFERAEARIAIPMREGVSSLNLATSVAIVLFALRLASGREEGEPGE
ncbi:MAG TPA: TrmH family RNA methyltransferase [Solirubrobacterales bacterium]|jgi:tRNA G18 (ribose-2'-O)-methylase SpoU|nr:TrmH family RNA methyltransferase [Solirubrobacterales bacterium]